MLELQLLSQKHSFKSKMFFTLEWYRCEPAYTSVCLSVWAPNDRLIRWSQRSTWGQVLLFVAAVSHGCQFPPGVACERHGPLHFLPILYSLSYFKFRTFVLRLGWNFTLIFEQCLTAPMNSSVAPSLGLSLCLTVCWILACNTAGQQRALFTNTHRW